MPRRRRSAVAVRHVLADRAPGDLVLVACSGGADSLALAAATAVEAPAAGLRAGAVVVDHGLQPGSAEVAARAARTLRSLGLDPVDVVTVEVTASGDGPEAAARTARYAALDAAADRHGAALVLLGHTRDDQAEQVLLGLTRGSGARSLSGMPSARGRFRAPPPRGDPGAVPRLVRGRGPDAWWDDPMNEDPGLHPGPRPPGPGRPRARPRDRAWPRPWRARHPCCVTTPTTSTGWPTPRWPRWDPQPWAVEALTGIPRAVRTRVWRRLLVAAGAPAGRVGARHTDACDRLLTGVARSGPGARPR